MSDNPGAWVAKFDATTDAWFEPLRGRPIPDRVFEIASHLGDWGLVWLIVTAAQALRSDDDFRRTPRLVATLMAESILVNQGIKRLFKRGRPGDRPLVSERLRKPVTTSFPSGHASSAACASVLLTEGDPRLAAVVLPIAVIVALSRVHTRMHHPTDVVAGALTGWAIGRFVVHRWSDPHRPGRRRTV